MNNYFAIYSLHHFISFGCIISPISSTCFGDNLYWADNKMSYKSLFYGLSNGLNGAGPDFRVEDPKLIYKTSIGSAIGLRNILLENLKNNYLF